MEVGEVVEKEEVEVKAKEGKQPVEEQQAAA